MKIKYFISVLIACVLIVGTIAILRYTDKLPEINYGSASNVVGEEEITEQVVNKEEIYQENTLFLLDYGYAILQMLVPIVLIAITIYKVISGRSQEVIDKFCKKSNRANIHCSIGIIASAIFLFAARNNYFYFFY